MNTRVHDQLMIITWNSLTDLHGHLNNVQNLISFCQDITKLEQITETDHNSDTKPYGYMVNSNEAAISAKEPTNLYSPDPPIIVLRKVCGSTV